MFETRVQLSVHRVQSTCPDAVEECAFPGSKVPRMIRLTLIILSKRSRNSIANSKLLAGSFLIMLWSLMFRVPGMLGYLAWKRSFEIIRPP